MGYEAGELKEFVRAMEREIRRVGAPPVKRKEEFLRFQEDQVNGIVELERQLRDELLTRGLGQRVYEAFCAYAKTLSSIMSSRSYFRERQEKFVDVLGPAIESEDWRFLSTYRINFRFIAWLMQSGIVTGDPFFVDLERRIRRLRADMVILLMPLAISRTRIFRGKTPPSHLGLQDLVQSAFEGLLCSVDKYVPPFSSVYRAVAIGRVTGELIESYSLLRQTVIFTCDGQAKRIEDFRAGDRVWGVDDEGRAIATEVVALHDHGTVDGFEVTFSDGYSVTCSAKHKFLTDRGMMSLDGIVSEGLGVLCEPSGASGGLGDVLRDHGGLKTSKGESPGWMRAMQGSSLGDQAEVHQAGSYEEHIRNGLGQSVWDQFRQKEGDVVSPEVLHGMPEIDHEGSGRSGLTVEIRQSREVAGQSKEGIGGLYQVEAGQPQGGGASKGAHRCRCATVAPGAPGGECLDSKEYAHIPKEEDFAAGDRTAGQRGYELGVCSNSMRCIKTKRGRLRIGGSQDLGRGGWFLALPGSQRDRERSSSVGVSTVKGRDTQHGGRPQGGCDIDPSIREMFREGSNRSKDQTGLAPMAYGHAPLTSTGGLVLRYVVRVRAVGLQRMYDLEVAHPKHNFLLPSGIVTSNSQTLLHFYPNDRKVLYRANKLHGRMNKGMSGTDYDAMAKRLNADAVAEAEARAAERVELGQPAGTTAPSFQTDAGEVAELMAASSHVSADALVGARRAIARMAAPEDQAPDRQAEVSEGVATVRRAARGLSLVQRKMLVLRGMLSVEEVAA